MLCQTGTELKPLKTKPKVERVKKKKDLEQMKVQKVQRVSNVWQNSWLKIDRKSERLWG